MSTEGEEGRFPFRKLSDLLTLAAQAKGLNDGLPTQAPRWDVELVLYQKEWS